jgi:methylated-DNA-[protein]-cysteine S-methyltransferase
VKAIPRPNREWVAGFSAIVAAPFGAIGIRVALGMVTELVYLPKEYAEHAFRERQALRAAHQVQRYLADPDFTFDLPLAPVGTAFQKRVWDQIRAIPRGQVRSYGGLAHLLRTSPRAVGQACRANWYPLVVPCHRVVAAEGLGGFAGTPAPHGDGAGESFQITAKRWLLVHEGVVADAGQASVA